MPDLADNLRLPFVDLLLALADDKLMMGHRNSDWTGLAPVLEEDIAFSSLAQDDADIGDFTHVQRRRNIGALPVIHVFTIPPVGQFNGPLKAGQPRFTRGQSCQLSPSTVQFLSERLYACHTGVEQRSLLDQIKL